MNRESLIQELSANKSFDDSNDESQAFKRFLQSLETCSGYSELFLLLAPKARYIGPGKWLDTIRQIYPDQH